MNSHTLKHYPLALLLAAGMTATAAHALTPEEQLGKSIFFDENLSINRDQSCATCHNPAFGWTGDQEGINKAGAVYEGSIPDKFGDRKPPSSAYATQSPILHYILKNKNKEALFVGGNFWDGRATGEKLGNPAADQAQGPFLNPVEQALPDSACVVYRVCTALSPSDSYPFSLESVWQGSCSIEWPDSVDETCQKENGVVDLSEYERAKSNWAYDLIALAIAAFEASPESNAFTSKFDRSFKGKVKFDRSFKGKVKLTQQERRGFALFKGKAQCARCHTVTAAGEKSLFTDFTYDNLGIPKNPENPIYNVNSDYVDPGLGGFLATRPDYAKFADANKGKHKVPTLRNVDKRTPEAFVKAYGHNGYFKSLKGIVNFYNTRDVKPACPGDYTEAQALAANCWPAPEVADNVNTDELGNLGLSDEDEDAIVAFMKTLSDGYSAPR